jgi:hypothetical protein
MTITKHKPVSIEFDSENSWIDRKSAKSIEEANKMLREATHTAPKLGYHKTNCKIIYDDGETYTARIDLHHSSQEQEGRNGVVDLGQHIYDQSMFYLGRRKPSRLTDEQYQQAISNMTTPERNAALQQFLENYDIGEVYE